MNSPVREPDDNEPLKDGPLKDAPLKDEPKRARRSDQNSNLNDAPKRGDAVPSRTMPEPPEPPEPPWKRKTQHGVFAGDVAAVELRSRLALVPDRIPEPPPASAARVFVAVGQLIGVILVAAAVAGVVGYLWSSAPSAKPPRRVLASNQADLRPGLSASAANHKASSFDSTLPAARPAATGLAPVDARGVAKEQNSRDAASALRQLTVNAVRLRQVDEPAQLTISAAGAGPNAWRLSTEDFSKTAVTPPRGFVGVMDLTLELRLADNTVLDHKGLQLEWSGRSALSTGKSLSQGADAAEIALMMKNGAQLMTNGDIAAARMMFQRAAEAGEAMGAFALAETYDPSMLKKLGTRGGITSDIALAQNWYEKARDLGSTLAPERLERLARVPE
jgi:TPR repeat protein